MNSTVFIDKEKNNAEIKIVKYGLKNEHIRIFLEIISKFDDVEKVALFGSRAMGNHKKTSDVDIAVFGKNVNTGLACAIKFEIEEETVIPYFFDVVAYPIIKNEKLKEHIDTKGIILWEKTKEVKNV
jgi:predicted nucleotidyltransferase